VLALRYRAPRQKSSHRITLGRHAQFVWQVVRGFPMRRLRACRLDGANLVQIAVFAAPDFEHPCYSIRVMRAIPVLLLFVAQPFWQSKSPDQWTDYELDTILHASPWAEMVGPSPQILVSLATAAPIEDAAYEQRLRSKRPLRQPDPDYTNFLVDHRDDDLVLAVSYTLPLRFGTSQERSRMEDESEMVIGRKSYKLIGHFPPTEDDPVLRLVFPREAKLSDKAVLFRLYVPGISFPEREVEFRVKDLLYRGKLAM
jgi:hypothetical protein